MKNFKLLLATTAMLSATAIVANADDLTSNQANLEVRASFLKPIQAIPETYLGFGIILADEGGKSVVVTPAGELGTPGEGKTQATMISSAGWTNYYDGDNGRYTTYSSLNAGKIRYKGIGNDTWDGANTMEMSAALANAAAKVTFSNDPVTLTSHNGADDGVTCGTVTNFTKNFTQDGNDLILNIGGELTTADLSSAGNSLVCVGNTTVTLVYDDELTPALANEFGSAAADAFFSGD